MQPSTEHTARTFDAASGSYSQLVTQIVTTLLVSILFLEPSM